MQNILFTCTAVLLAALCTTTSAGEQWFDTPPGAAITTKKAFWKNIYGEIDSSCTVVYDKTTLHTYAVVKNCMVDKTIDSLKKTVSQSRNIMVKQGRKEFIHEAIRRAAEYPFIPDSLAAYKLHPDLRWLPVLESGYLDTMVSDQDARGIWQFIPSTGKVYGLAPDEITDPHKSTSAFVRYFSVLYKEFGDYGLAVTAYHHGEGGIRTKLRKRKATSLEAILPDLGFMSGNYYAKLLSIVELAHELPTATPADSLTQTE